jgi:rubrerythrin
MNDDQTPDGVDVHVSDDGQVELIVKDDQGWGSSEQRLSRLEALALARALLETSRSAGQTASPEAIDNARAKAEVTDGGEKRGGESTDSNRTQVSCPRCGFNWTEHGNSDVVTCPSCNTPTNATG